MLRIMVLGTTLGQMRRLWRVWVVIPVRGVGDEEARGQVNTNHFSYRPPDLPDSPNLGTEPPFLGIGGGLGKFPVQKLGTLDIRTKLALDMVF